VDTWTFDSRGPEQTLEAGRELGRSIGSEGLTIALVGPLGAGKTVFVKGLAEGLGIDPRIVSSPTFVIAQQYIVPEGPDVLHHIDLYRLESEDELEAIGFYDMFEPGAVLAAEWADRFPGVLGREVLSIELQGPAAEKDDEASAEPGLPVSGTGPARSARVTAQGDAARMILSDWSDRLDRLDRDGPGRAARPGTGSFVEMRRGLTIVLALALWVSAQIDFSGGRLPICEALVPSHADELGTSRAECVSEAVLSGRNVGVGVGTEGELEGVALLLAGGRIDLNRAGANLLETLPGIGTKRAEAIVRARRERPFASVVDLERVPGIGPKTRARLARWLRVETVDEGGAVRDG